MHLQVEGTTQIQAWKLEEFSDLQVAGCVWDQVQGRRRMDKNKAKGQQSSEPAEPFTNLTDLDFDTEIMEVFIQVNYKDNACPNRQGVGSQIRAFIRGLLIPQDRIAHLPLETHPTAFCKIHPFTERTYRPKRRFDFSCLLRRVFPRTMSATPLRLNTKINEFLDPSELSPQPIIIFISRTLG